MGTAAPIVMHIFSNVGKLREMAECTHHCYSGLVAQLVEYHVKFVPSLRVLLPPKANCGLTDAFDKIESRFTFLFTQRIAQHASQQADVLAQGIVLDRPLFIVSMISGGAFVLGNKSTHNAALLAMHMREDALCAAIQVGVWHAKINISSNSVIFSL